MTGTIPRTAAKLAAVLLASIAVVAVAAGSASASNSVGGNPSLGAAGLNGAQALFAAPTHVRYEALYEDPIAGPVKCVGNHQTNEKKGYPGTETSGGRDKFNCRSTTKKPLTGVVAGETGESETGLPGATAWYSDYFFALNSSLVPAKENPAVPAKGFTWSVSANGKVFHAVAYY